MTDSVFVYGTLMPGQARWTILAPYVAGEPVRDQIVGRLVDTGHGYPALIELGTGGVVHGWVVGLDPQRRPEALVLLDEIEGTASELYVRELVRTARGVSCWTYRYLRPTEGMADLGGTWT